MIQIKQKDLRKFRRKQWKKQDKKCAVTGKPLLFTVSVVDHCHKRKDEEAGPDGKGMIRGVLHRDVNQFEGRINSVYKRYGLKTIMLLPELLRRLANFLENPVVTGYIHPSAIKKIKKKKLNKTDIKRVQKYWKQMYPKRTLKFPAVITKGKKSFYNETKQWREYIKQSRVLAGLKE